MRKVFLDTGFAIALASQRDAFHRQAISIAEDIEVDQTLIVTTRAVLVEIGNALSAPFYRTAAANYIEDYETRSEGRSSHAIQ